MACASKPLSRSHPFASFASFCSNFSLFSDYGREAQAVTKS
jgi:hypothetical protein